MRSVMAGLFVVPLMAAQLAAALPPPAFSSRVSASAQATVRILSAAKIRLGSDVQPEGYKLSASSVRLEDGSRRPAKLVEFQ